MQTGTINNKTMQRSNLALVLRTIYESDGISRRDVAAHTGLTPSSVTNIVSRLIDDGLVLETDDAPDAPAVGRRPIRLHVNAGRHAIVGVELSADRITAVVTDFCGEPIALEHADLPGGCTPAAAVERMREMTERLLAARDVPKSRVLGLGLMSSGPYDAETGTMFDPPNFTGWHNVPIGRMTADALSLPVCFDRDSVGCALDAQALLNKQAGTLFAVMVNTIGIGGALVVDGEVYYGLHNCAAEIGCMTVLPGGPQCRCGDRGCLEAIATSDALLRWMRERIALGAPDPFEGRAETADAAALAKAYRAGRSLAVEAVERGAKYLGIAMGNIIKIVSPDVIALGGGFLSALPEYYDLILKEATARRQAQPEFVPFAHGPIQCALGGTRLVLLRYFKSLEA